MDQETMFQGTACTLEQVLQSRTDRQDRQQALLKKGCSCLLSFGLNVPGAVKQSPAPAPWGRSLSATASPAARR